MGILGFLREGDACEESFVICDLFLSSLVSLFQCGATLISPFGELRLYILYLDLFEITHDHSDIRS